MCGLIGIIPIKNSYISQAMTVVFEQLIWVGALRGWNGTGVFKLNHNNIVEYLKVPHAPPEFFEAVDQYKYSLFGQLLVGHNRATTKGQNIYEHTHPFQEEHITLVHNGTLYNHKDLGDKEVDSHVICQMLSKHKSPQDLVDDIEGAYALIWYDNKVKRLFALRNKERPLHIIKTQDYFILVSELEMGLWILNRNNIKVVSTHEITPFSLYEFNPGNQYKVTKLKEPKLKYLALVHDLKKNTHGTPQKLIGLTIGEEIEVKTLYCNDSNSGFGDCWGHLKDNPNTTVKYWSKHDYTDVDVTVQITSFVGSNRAFYILGKDPKVLPNTKEDEFTITDSNFLDEEEYLHTANGVDLTQEVLRMTKDSNCVTCSADFVYSTNITLYPQRRNGHVYKYTYYCPECTKKQQIRFTNPEKSVKLLT